MEYFAQKVPLTLITCNSNRPTDFKPAGIYNSAFSISKLNNFCSRYDSSESLKELRNCILQIMRVWSLFCSVRVHTSPHFLPILLGKELFVFLRCVELKSM